MECYWDQAFIAQVDPNAEIVVNSLPVARAELGYRGYMRESSPDGLPPTLFDYDLVEPATLSQLPGLYTRFGDVTSLLQNDDDQHCVFGSGEEVKIEFNGQSLPPVPKGWVREYVLRSVGYCKDADLFSVTGDDVGPLPWKGMKEYPFGKNGARPMDDAYRAYLRDFQTRRVVEQ